MSQDNRSFDPYQWTREEQLEHILTMSREMGFEMAVLAFLEEALHEYEGDHPIDHMILGRICGRLGDSAVGKCERCGNPAISDEDGVRCVSPSCQHLYAYPMETRAVRAWNGCEYIIDKRTGEIL